jgi:hypothetical protein
MLTWIIGMLLSTLIREGLGLGNVTLIEKSLIIKRSWIFLREHWLQHSRI